VSETLPREGAIRGKAGRFGLVIETIVVGSDGALMIVVGSKGVHGNRRFLLGSVPDKVSHHAPCSVLIVRTS
jgi:nucleotide-binding universal stress UspA family protein